MKCKTAYLIINPRFGKKINDLSAMMAVLSAAGWKIDTAIKEFGGHTRKLARKAANAGYDLVIGVGGDGTLNQVVNGVMSGKRRGCIVGVIPGGTANVWAHEIGISEDPVKASLLLINSEGCKVDVGHVAVNLLPFPSIKKDRQKEDRQQPRGRHHFLLMAGLGIDAAIMRQVPTSLKERIGKAAVALAAVKTLPSQHAFAVEIWSSGEGTKEALRWRGEALQVIVGNTRLYGNFAEATPDALIDDGALDVCIITAGNPLSTIEQVLSILLHRNPRNGRSEHFRGSHFWINAPASIDLQLDGSRVKLDAGVPAPGRTAHRQTQNPEPVMVTYRFDAIPRALRVAIPCTYDGALFENGSAKQTALPAEKRRPNRDAVRAVGRPSKDVQHQDAQRLHALLERGPKVTVVGVAPNPERKTTYIVAGRMSGKKTGTSKPVAVRIDQNTTIIGPGGELLPVTFAAKLQEDAVIVVEGKQSKRGVVRAKRVVVVN
ncbi:MAG: YegS/Rv2252/BmrU family lipid kinase [Gemmatimonadota bacterium]|nr:YegS/Rv2252/BmrU family lipid kinase [Gemmatimonadota bacterium]